MMSSQNARYNFLLDEQTNWFRIENNPVTPREAGQLRTLGSGLDNAHLLYSHLNLVNTSLERVSHEQMKQYHTK